MDKPIAPLEAMTLSAEEWRIKYGYWKAHPEHPIEDWRSEVINDDTRQGYWQWAIAREQDDATV